MIIKLESFKGGASVCMEYHSPSGYLEVRRRGYAGNLIDKVLFDTRERADECFDDFVRDALKDDE